MPRYQYQKDCRLADHQSLFSPLVYLLELFDIILVNPVSGGEILGSSIRSKR
jgi:hypothetical protein